jgi:hypothetical protein
MKYKTIIIKFIVLLIIPLMGFKKDKCNSDTLYEQGLTKLKKYSVLKDYRIYSKKKKKLTAEDYQYFTVSLNRGVTYKFFAFSNPDMEGKMVINLYTTPTREYLFATTLSQGTRSVHESVEFKCNNTANYCIGYYFLDGNEGCGVAISAFKQD